MIGKKHIIWVLSIEFVVILLAITIAFFQNCDIDKYFEENTFVSWFSFINLIFISQIAGIIFYNMFTVSENGESHERSFKKRLAVSFIWIGVAAGFLFLALDEVMMIHERMDRAIHLFFGITRTELTDRLNDLFVLLYAIIGLVAIYFSRKSLMFFKKSRYLLASAILCFLIMMIFDYLGKDNNDYNQRSEMTVYEESFKLIGGGFFILSALNCLKISEKIKRKGINNFGESKAS